MESFNYNHLFYFWMVARKGSVSQASAELRLSQPTVSEQIGKLEEDLGVTLFEREGRGIRLSGIGQQLFGYADQIFRIGREMREAVQGGSPATTMRLSVGLALSFPSALALKLLSPVLRDKNVHLSCIQDRVENLLGKLALRQLDVVLSDVQISPSPKLRLFNHKVGTSGLSFISSPKLRLRGKFPRSLDGVPVLMPDANSKLHDELENWFAKNEVRPKIVGEVSGEFAVSLGREGVGVFVVPTLIEREVLSAAKMTIVGRTTAIKQDFFALAPERRPANAAVMTIIGTKHA